MTNEINKNSPIAKIKSIILPKANQQKIVLPEQKPDTFEYSQTYNDEMNTIRDDKSIEQRQQDKDDEMSEMKFQSIEIQFYPEDEEKMKTMSHKEKMEFVKRLRQENRYVEVDDKEN